MENIARYLRLSHGYFQALALHSTPSAAGIRWSRSADALEYADGTKLAFAAQMGLFLEGMAAGRPPISFSHIVHLLILLGHGHAPPPKQFAALRRAYDKTGRPMRNAGSLIRHLSQTVPPTSIVVTTEAVCQHLHSRALMRDVELLWDARRRPTIAERPALGPDELETVIGYGLYAMREAELIHWMKHGRGPLENEAEEIVAQMPVPPPRNLGDVLASLSRKPRVRGALPYVAQMISAISLPPRRLDHHQLAMGGYSDVTTHGNPEQILPSQFALDRTEFLRRFAQRELLYFRREDPQERPREDLVVLLDQGIRTWGDVRLILMATLLALGDQAHRRSKPFAFATTGNDGEIVDPLEVDEDHAARLIEASDLTAQPGAALERILTRVERTLRDVVLLTHPRGLREDDVIVAAKRLDPFTRLFAVAVEESGQVEFAELRRGQPIGRRRFAVQRQEEAKAASAPNPPRSKSAPWEGDIEPVPYPFVFGAASVVRQFAFDDSGDWLLTATSDNMLYASSTDGMRAEVLPRALVNGQLVQTHEICGVADGFVIGASVSGQLAAVHYDFTRRTVRAHVLGPIEPRLASWHWSYVRECHTVIVDQRQVVMPDHGGWLCRGVDLATGQAAVPGSAPPQSHSRVQQAMSDPRQRRYAHARLDVLADEETRESMRPAVLWNGATGSLTVRTRDGDWAPFTPIADGKPLLLRSEMARNNSNGISALLEGDILALKFGRDKPVLRLYRGPQGVLIHETPLADRRRGVELSLDGRFVAYAQDDTQIQVRSAETGNLVLNTLKGRFHPKVQLSVGATWLIISTGQNQHVLNWSYGRVEIRRLERGEHFRLHSAPVRFNTEVPDFLAYDRSRFRVARFGSWLLGIDRFGQIAVFDGGWRLLFMLFVFRDRIAAWRPDGAYFGSPLLCLGAPREDTLESIHREFHASALERIRHALPVPSDPPETWV
jgi:hypothetical protein